MARKENVSVRKDTDLWGSVCGRRQVTRALASGVFEPILSVQLRLICSHHVPPPGSDSVIMEISATAKQKWKEKKMERKNMERKKKGL
jgi:hypothetical protein